MRPFAGSAVLLAVRAAFRNPRWALMPVVTLALGVGAATTILTLLKAIELDGLPFPEASRLTLLTGTRTAEGETTEWPLGYLDFLDWRERVSSFEGLAVASDARAFNLSVGSDVERVQAELVTGDLFAVLGLRAALGTLPAPSTADQVRETDRRQALAGQVVVSHAFWERWFAGSSEALGAELRLNGRLFTVRAVLEPGFRGVSDDADMWVPIQIAAEFLAPRYIDDRAARWLTAVARLSEGASLASAREELQVVSDRMQEEYPDTNRGHGVEIASLEEAWFGDLRPVLTALFIGAAMVFLIGAANVGGLLLVRASSRRNEAAVMIALGARPRDLAAASAGEGVVVGLAGWSIGFAAAAALARPLIAWSPLDLRASIEIAPTVGVGLWTLAGSTMVMASAGVFPLAGLLRRSAVASLSAGGRTITGIGARSRQALVAGEIGLALMLVAAAGVLYADFAALRKRDLGFRPEGVLAARLDLKGDHYASIESRVQLINALLDELPAAPNVDGIAAAGPGVPGDDWFGLYFIVDEPPPSIDPDEFVLLPYHSVSRDYFDALSIPLLRGRGFQPSDDRAAPLVAVVSEGLAERYWPGTEAIGRRLKSGPRESAAPWITVVGVVGDVEHQGLSAATRPGPDLYLSAYQFPPNALSLLVRTSPSNTYGVAERVRAAATRAAPGLPLFDVASLRDRLRAQTSQTRFSAGLMMAFAVVAVLLSAMGMYGLIAYTATLRTREIGTRLALGAPPGLIVLDVVRSAIVVSLGGVVVGAAGALVLRGFVDELVREMPQVGIVLLVAGALLVLVAAIASYRPARRAAGISPVEAWR